MERLDGSFKLDSLHFFLRRITLRVCKESRLYARDNTQNNIDVAYTLESLRKHLACCDAYGLEQMMSLIAAAEGASVP